MAKLSKQIQKRQFGKKFNQEYFDLNKQKTIQYCDWLKSITYDINIDPYFTTERVCGTKHDKIDFETGELKVQTWYCRKRWCSNCNQMSMKNAINKYRPLINEMKNTFFITLTAKTVKVKFLQSRLENMQIAWEQIKKNAFLKGIELNGIKKLEIVHSYPYGDTPHFHPHYHILVDSIQGGQFIIDEWIKQITRLEGKRYVDRTHLDIKEATENFIIELFKYTLKPQKTTGLDKQGNRTVQNRQGKQFIVSNNQEATRNLYLKGKRTYQPFGNLYKAIQSNLKKS